MEASVLHMLIVARIHRDAKADTVHHNVRTGSSIYEIK